MRYGSVCSGIEAATVAWEPLGWTPAFFSEIDPFCSSLLDQRYSGVPNYGDFTQLLDPAHPVHSQPPIDVLVGGTPCQDFSIAGLRAGVAGARGSLTLDFCRLVDVLRPRWVVWENVPGVLSSDGGRALGAFTGALAELGYGFAWRVLDAQYFGLAQRRKRVFVVGHSGGQQGRPGAVLLEPEGVRGDPPSRKQARQVAPANARGRAACGVGRTATAITERRRRDGLNLEHQDEVAYALTNPGDGGRTNNRMVALREAEVQSIAFYPNMGQNARTDGESIELATTISGANGGNKQSVATFSPEVAGTLGGSSQSGGFRTTDLDNSGAFIAYRKSSRARSVEDSETWIPADVSNTLNVFDAGDIRTTHIVLEPREPGQAVAVSFNQRCEARTSEIMYTISAQPGVDEQPVFKNEAEAPDGPQQEGSDPFCFAFQPRIGRNGRGQPEPICPTLYGSSTTSSTSDMRPCVEIFTGDGEVADPVSAHEAKTYTHKGNVFRMHNCVGFYPTGGTHGVSATDEGMPPLKVETGEGGNAPAVAFNGYQRTKGSITWPLGACDGRKVEVGVRQGFSVRRLTPRECERLQGFPDDYTLVPYRKGLSADGHRYKALGNSMAVPVMRWIGARIYLVDQLDQGE